MNRRPTAAAAGKIDVGGDLTVNRLGFGAMQITGAGIWVIRQGRAGPAGPGAVGPRRPLGAPTRGLRGQPSQAAAGPD